MTNDRVSETSEVGPKFVGLCSRQNIVLKSRHSHTILYGITYNQSTGPSAQSMKAMLRPKWLFVLQLISWISRCVLAVSQPGDMHILHTETYMTG